ncbi:hypothetical protein CCACVL1_06123 [Corchorus capsularis]|uniref:Uncharacterized protein n=1 Tax=Corchorus capsularis TaxID=210143 RepID=A0A1R3JHB6_COCAP|nr:hypothetical protein CCACVL1_06123 [Corchorus capsularis]
MAKAEGRHGTTFSSLVNSGVALLFAALANTNNPLGPIKVCFGAQDTRS